MVGKDVLVEKEENVTELYDLKFGYCRLVIAGLTPLLDPKHFPHDLRVATKYPHSSEAYFKKKGIKVNLLKLYGAVELAPLTGLADVICDLVATGKTLEENNLGIIDTVYDSTARLVANTIALRTHYTWITYLVDALERLTPR